MKPLLLLLTLMLAAAVSPAAPAASSAGPTVGSDRLRNIMDEINRHLADDTDTGAVPGETDAGQLAELTAAIEELLYHAELMSTDAAPRGLDANQVVTFRALASQLYSEVLNLRAIAEPAPVTTYDFNLLNAAQERLFETCTACHALFRDPQPGGQ